MANLTANATVSYNLGANYHTATHHVSTMTGQASFSVVAFDNSTCIAGTCVNSSSPLTSSGNFSQSIYSSLRPGAVFGHASIQVSITVIGYLLCELVATGATFSTGSVLASMANAASPDGVTVSSLTIT